MVKEVYLVICECKEEIKGDFPTVFPIWITCGKCGKKYGIHIIPDGVTFKAITTPETFIIIKKEGEWI
jgi:hypothetical protein